MRDGSAGGGVYVVSGRRVADSVGREGSEQFSWQRETSQPRSGNSEHQDMETVPGKHFCI